MRRFFQELRRRHVLRTAGAYIVIAWLIVQVIDTVAPALGWPDGTMRFALISLAAGFPLVVILSWFFDVVGGRVQLDDHDDPKVARSRAIDLVVIAVLGAALIVALFFKPILQPQSASTETKNHVVAVLPLDNLTPVDDADSFAVGLHDDLLTTLSRIDSLRVISRTSVMQLTPGVLSIPQIGARLGATAILRGSVQRTGERIRVNVTLIDATSDTSLWAESFNKPFSTDGVFEIQALIARNIARELTSVLGNDEQKVDAVAPPSNMEAYRAYLLGKRRVQERTSASLAEAVDKLRRAVELDPSFAPAYAELAMAYSLQSSYSNLSTRDLISVAMPVAQRAVELGPGLAEAHTALADLRLAVGDEAGARESFRRAIQLNPNYPLARHWYAIMLAGEGQLEDALSEHRIARDLDPLSVLMTLNVAQDLLMLGRADEALREYEHALEIDPQFTATYAHLANIYRVSMGRHDLAVKWLLDAYAADAGHTEYPSQLAGTYLELDQPDAARVWVQRALDLGPEQFWPNRAALLLALYTDDKAAIRKHANFIHARAPTAMVPMIALRDLYVDENDIDAARGVITRGYPDLMTSPPTLDAESYAAAIALAYLYRGAGDDKRATELLRSALPFAETQARTGNFGYDIADVELQAMLGNTDEALARLSDAIQNKWRRQWWRLRSNRHLESVHDDPRFITLWNTLREDARRLSADVPLPTEGNETASAGAGR